MDPSCSDTSEDKQTRDLEVLLDAFGSVCNLEEIASAYCKAGADVNATGEILYELQESKSSGGIHNCKGTMDFARSEESFHENNAKTSTLLRKNSKGSKPNKSTVSMGTVSSVLGKEYFRINSSSIQSLKATKPLKLELKEPLTDEPVGETAESDPAARHEPISNKDVEEFLFSMLGDGFKLQEDKILDVLGSCGYDMRKSMEELLETSPSNLEKCKMAENSTARPPKLESYMCEGDYPTLASTQRNVTESSTMDKERSDLPKILLETLFNVPKRSEELSARTRFEIGLNRTRVVGQKAVSVPMDEIDTKPSAEIASAWNPKVVEDEEDNYQVLRRAAKQHWIAMKAYYEAAIDAFTKGERTKANYLLEQGKFYNKKAREADEKSSGEIVDIKNTENPSEVTLDLHCHGAKGAIRLLKCHLRSLASISSIQFLKVIVDADSENVTNGKRRQWVIQLLEKESIKWIPEEGNAGTILIRVDVIDPNKLSFVKD